MNLLFTTAIFAAVVLVRADGAGPDSCTCDGYIKGSDNQDIILFPKTIPDSIDCTKLDECSQKCLQWAKDASNGGNLCTLINKVSIGNTVCSKFQSDVTDVKPLLRHTLCGKQGETNIDFFQSASCKAGSFTGQCSK